MLAPSEIRPDALPKRLGGYDRESVASLLEELGVAYERAKRARDDAHDRAGALERELAERAALDGRFRETLLAAQREANAMRERARREADVIRARAGASCAAKRQAVADEAERIRKEMDAIRAIERDVRVTARAILEEALARLETVDPREGVPAPQGATEPHLAAPPGGGSRGAAARPAEPAPRATAEPVAPPAGPVPPDDTVVIPPLALATEVAGPAAAPEQRPAPDAGGRRFGLRTIGVSVAILVVGALVAIGIWQLSERDDPTPAVAPLATVVDRSGTAAATTTIAPPPAAATTVAAPPAAAADAVATQAASPEPPTTRLVLRAAGGDCWLSVHAGSADGRLLFEGFLYQGERRRFSARKVWVRAGSASRLAARLDGKPADLPAGTVDFVAAGGRIRTVGVG